MAIILDFENQDANSISLKSGIECSSNFLKKILLVSIPGLTIAISQSYDLLLCPFSSKDILFKKEFLFLIDFFHL